ncbi:MAG: type II toxin-antitoxin system YafQ family toxin [Synergistaceae bacterium]|nr:type II toxin-antitoxin system YafQ family toxin [Synergistaceae bacterium]
MRVLVLSAQYKKDLRRLEKQKAPLKFLSEAVTMLCEDQPLPESYRDHALAGKLRQYRELHAAPDLLLIYCKRGNDLLLLAAAGSHSELYGR